MAHPNDTTEQRRKYVPDAAGCWIWQGAKTPRGYGRINIKRRYIYAHRFYYEQANGPIPDGMYLDHLCRNPSCVNPDHLEAVTPAENVRRGNVARLSAGDVAAIREASPRNPAARQQLAERFGVTPRTIYDIVKGYQWR